MLCSQMSCIAITPKRQRVHKIIKLNKAQNEAHKKCMKLANERRGKSSRAVYRDRLIHGPQVARML